MMKLTNEQLQQVKATGWTREVAFKTTPSVTKLEIAAFLEAVYGMQVERVSTINYLGRPYVTLTTAGRQLQWREDDWKKAYVVFRPPPGMEAAAQRADAARALTDGSEQQQREGEERGRDVPVVERIREAARAPRRKPKTFPWSRNKSVTDAVFGGRAEKRITEGML